LLRELLQLEDSVGFLSLQKNSSYKIQEYHTVRSILKLGSNPDISQKYKMGDISKRVANTLTRLKNLQKNFTN
jgi:hypothetical protein